MNATQENNEADEQTHALTSVSRRNILKFAGAIGAIGGLTGFATADDSSATTAGDFDLIEATVDELHDAFTSGLVTIQDVVQEYIDRIEAYDDDLNAIITVNPNAIEQAEELDDELADSGFRGPLHGIPILLKDNLDTHDMPTTAGNVLFEDTIPPDDAFLTAQLRVAGGIILAKANLGEFASGSLSSLGGQTHNPYDLPRQTGGSSSGTGAGIAANFGVLGIGTDTGGSVRHPSGFCSLVGLRPTTGLLSRDGIIPLSETEDTAGPMTRTVTDAAVTMDAMVGYDPADPWTARTRDNAPDSYVRCLKEDGLEGARIGVLRQLFGPKTDEGENPELEAQVVTDIIDTALDDMAAAGAEIIDSIKIPDVEEMSEEADVSIYETERDLEMYLDSLGDAAPVDSVEEIEKSGTIEGRRDLKDEVEIDLDDAEVYNEYQEALNRRRDVQELVLTNMEDEDLDAVAYPMASRIPPLIDEERSYSTAVNTGIAPSCGFPAITVPAGFATEWDLPVGLELMAGPFEEERLFEMTYAYEQTSMQRRPPENYGTL